MCEVTPSVSDGDQSPLKVGPHGNTSDKCPIKCSEDPYSQSSFSPRRLQAPDLAHTRVYMQIAGPPPSRILLLLMEGGEDAWPPSGQTGDTGCEWESGGLVCWWETQGRGTEARA